MNRARLAGLTALLALSCWGGGCGKRQGAERGGADGEVVRRPHPMRVVKTSLYPTTAFNRLRWANRERGERVLALYEALRLHSSGPGWVFRPPTIFPTLVDCHWLRGEGARQALTAIPKGFYEQAGSAWARLATVKVDYPYVRGMIFSGGRNPVKEGWGARVDVTAGAGEVAPAVFEINLSEWAGGAMVDHFSLIRYTYALPEGYERDEKDRRTHPGEGGRFTLALGHAPEVELGRLFESPEAFRRVAGKRLADLQDRIEAVFARHGVRRQVTLRRRPGLGRRGYAIEKPLDDLEEKLLLDGVRKRLGAWRRAVERHGGDFHTLLCSIAPLGEIWK